MTPSESVAQAYMDHIASAVKAGEQKPAADIQTGGEQQQQATSNIIQEAEGTSFKVTLRNEVDRKLLVNTLKKHIGHLGKEKLVADDEITVVKAVLKALG